MKKFLQLLLLPLLGLPLSAAATGTTTTLYPGDIAFVGYNARYSSTQPKGDEFSFIVLTDLAPGTQITFSNSGYTDPTASPANSLQYAGYYIVWEAPAAGTTPGTVVRISGVSTGGYSTTSGSVASSTGASGSTTLFLSLSTVGEQLVAFQGASSVPSTGSAGLSLNFIGAIQFYYASADLDPITGWSQTCAFNSAQRSVKYPGLTNGQSCVVLADATNPTPDNGKYTGPLTGTACDVRAAINNKANWSFDDVNLFPIGPTNYTIGTITAPPPAPTGATAQTQPTGSTVASLTATGTAVKWYATATSTSALSGTTALVSGTTYYATQTVASCESSARMAVTATLVAANQQPTDLTLSNSTLAENNAANAVVGTFSTTDPDAGDTFTYALLNGTGGSDNGSFAISGNTLRLTPSADFETKSQYFLRVSTTDQGGQTINRTFTLNITNVNEAPVITGQSRNVAENSANATNVGSPVTASDPDAGTTLAYSITGGNAAGKFAINSSTGQITVAGALDYEATSFYALTVTVSDGALSSSAGVSVSVDNVNEAPTALNLSNNSVAENEAANTLVGTFTNTDPGRPAPLTGGGAAQSPQTAVVGYVLVSGAGSTDNAAFTIPTNTNELRLRASANFEVKSSYAIRVRVTDLGGLSFEQPFTINITDVNEAPSDPTISNNRIDENVPVGTAIGRLSATDPEGGPVTYSLEPSGTAAAYFTVVGNEVRTIAPIDYEEWAALGSLVYADDAQGNRGFAYITIFFNDVLEDYTINAAQVLPEGIWNNVTVTGTGVADLNFNQSTIRGTFRVQAGGRVNLPQQNSLSGSGAFVLEAGATVWVSQQTSLEAAGVSSGAVQTTTRQFSDDAIYIFEAENNVNRGMPSLVIPMGTGVPATVRELEVTSGDPASAGRRSLSQPVAVRRRLVLSGGTLDTDGYALTLLSDATRTAYAVHSGGTTLGNVTVQRFVGNPAAASYRHLSSPVQGATVADLTTAGFTPKVNPAYNALPQPSLTAANFPNIFGFDETRGGTAPAYAGFTTGYFSPATLSQTLTPGRGYSTYLPGNRTPDLVGALTTGDLSLPLSVTGTVTASNKAGWHLLGNPYAQPIDWDLATIPAGMDAAVYVWYSTGGTAGGYRTRVNGTGNLTDGVIALGQGLWLRATAATTFTFTNALRVENGTIGLGRAAQSTAAAVLSLTLTDATGAQDEVTVAAHPGATTDFDGAFDATRPGANVGVPTLSALINGEPALVSTLAEAVAQGQSATVELTATLPAVGRYTLGVNHFTGWDAATVELLDRTTGTRYALTPQTTLVLTATRTNEAVTGRFALLFNQSRVLGTAATSVAAPSLAVSPNPVSAGGSVRVTGCPVSLPLTVLDLTGRKVGTAVADAQGTATVAVRTLAAGTYLVRTADGRTSRLVVE